MSHKTGDYARAYAQYQQHKRLGEIPCDNCLDTLVHLYAQNGDSGLVRRYWLRMMQRKMFGRAVAA